MNGTTTSTRFRLSMPSGLSVDVSLRAAAGRWIASAEVGGEGGSGVPGLGATARQALVAALASLDRHTVDALLADPVLFGVSAEVLRISRLASLPEGARP